LIVPRYRLNSYGRRCFAVAGPSTWNSLPDSLRDPELSLNIFRRQLKTHFFCEILTRCTKHIRDFLRMRYINLHFTYLLAYFEPPNLRTPMEINIIVSCDNDTVVGVHLTVAGINYQSADCVPYLREECVLFTLARPFQKWHPCHNFVSCQLIFTIFWEAYVTGSLQQEGS